MSKINISNFAKNYYIVSSAPELNALVSRYNVPADNIVVIPLPLTLNVHPNIKGQIDYVETVDKETRDTLDTLDTDKIIVMHTQTICGSIWAGNVMLLMEKLYNCRIDEINIMQYRNINNLQLSKVNDLEWRKNLIATHVTNFVLRTMQKKLYDSFLKIKNTTLDNKKYGFAYSTFVLLQAFNNRPSIVSLVRHKNYSYLSDKSNIENRSSKSDETLPMNKFVQLLLSPNLFLDSNFSYTQILEYCVVNCISTEAIIEGLSKGALSLDVDDHVIKFLQEFSNILPVYSLESGSVFPQAMNNQHMNASTDLELLSYELVKVFALSNLDKADDLGVKRTPIGIVCEHNAIFDAMVNACCLDKKGIVDSITFNPPTSAKILKSKIVYERNPIEMALLLGGMDEEFFYAMVMRMIEDGLLTISNGQITSTPAGQMLAILTNNLFPNYDQMLCPDLDFTNFPSDKSLFDIIQEHHARVNMIVEQFDANVNVFVENPTAVVATSRNSSGNKVTRNYVLKIVAVQAGDKSHTVPVLTYKLGEDSVKMLAPYPKEFIDDKGKLKTRITSLARPRIASEIVSSICPSCGHTKATLLIERFKKVKEDDSEEKVPVVFHKCERCSAVNIPPIQRP